MGPSRGVMEWQPIETAPKDGTKFIALLKCGDVSMVWWERDEWGDGDYWDNAAGDDPVPTHWMPYEAHNS